MVHPPPAVPSLGAEAGPRRSLPPAPHGRRR
jgi:hypothetical protein